MELLLAIGIVAILAALLIPAFNSLRAGGANARCVSNLRQLGVATLVYFGDHDGRLLPSTFWFRSESASSTIPGFDQSGIAEYLGLQAPFSGLATYRDTVLSCPAFKAKFPSLFPSQWNRSYSVNKYAHMYDPGSQQGGISNTPLFPGNLRKVRKPSATWLYMDGAASTSGNFVFTYLSPEHLSYLGFPHAKKQNTVFFDGHVEAIDTATYKLSETSDFWGGPN